MLWFSRSIPCQEKVKWHLKDLILLPSCIFFFTLIYTIPYLVLKSIPPNLCFAPPFLFIMYYNYFVSNSLAYVISSSSYTSIILLHFLTQLFDLFYCSVLFRVCGGCTCGCCCDLWRTHRSYKSYGSWEDPSVRVQQHILQHCCGH